MEQQIFDTSASFLPPSIKDDALLYNHERSSAADLNEASIGAVFEKEQQLPTSPKAKVAFDVEEGEIKQRAPPFGRLCRSRTDVRDNNLKWASVAKRVYELKTSKYDSNLSLITLLFAEHEHEVLLAPLLARCPNFPSIVAEMLVNKLRFSAKEVDFKSRTEDWGEEECRKVGMSMSPYLKDTQTGEAALHGWKLNFPQIETLLDEIEGFEAFMLVITNNLLRDSNYGMVFRVATGAVLSTIDGITDIYVINSYYNSEGLHGQANAMLAMLTTNIIIQLLFVLVQYKKKNWKVKVREALICLFFLRPAIDAYRVSTNHEDEETTLSQLTEMVCTKVRIWNCAYSESFSYS